jgi:hypothetical protein
MADHLQGAVAGQPIERVVERRVPLAVDDLDRAPVDEILGVTPAA